MRAQFRFTFQCSGMDAAAHFAAFEAVATILQNCAGYDFRLMHSADFKVREDGTCAAGNVFGLVTRLVSDIMLYQAIQQLRHHLNSYGVKIWIFNIYATRTEIRNFPARDNVFIDKESICETDSMPF